MLFEPGLHTCGVVHATMELHDRLFLEPLLTDRALLHLLTHTDVRSVLTVIFIQFMQESSITLTDHEHRDVQLVQVSQLPCLVAHLKGPDVQCLDDE